MDSADKDFINPDMDVTIESLRGARPVDCVKRCTEIAKTKKFKRICVHFGTNLIPRYSPARASDLIIQAIEDIKLIFPESEVTYSCILPKYGDWMLPAISSINSHVEYSGKSGPKRFRFKTIHHSLNFSKNGLVDPLMFRKDALHLSDDCKLAFNLNFNFHFGK